MEVESVFPLANVRGVGERVGWEALGERLYMELKTILSDGSPGRDCSILMTAEAAVELRDALAAALLARPAGSFGLVPH